MNTVMIHPIYGAKIATMEAEMEADIKQGWTQLELELEEKVDVKPARKSKVVSTVDTQDSASLYEE